MKKLITIAFLLLADYALWAQTPCDDFRAYLYNKEYGVFLKIDLCDESITIPDQDFYGSLPGYMGKKVNCRSQREECQTDDDQRIRQRRPHRLTGT